MILTILNLRKMMKQKTEDSDNSDHSNVCDDFFMEVMNIFLAVIYFVLNCYSTFNLKIYTPDVLEENLKIYNPKVLEVNKTKNKIYNTKNAFSELDVFDDVENNNNIEANENNNPEALGYYPEDYAMIPWRQTDDDDQENQIDICDEFFFEIMNLFFS
ncbi:hypothetical protein DERP_013253 [Dermatophagoides pteronyssinus]|uniref:Uncharacterized protein n=1 Tax=Dermatophagoides pteronyssinus TaxID=6956 RepID=A0ABQ8IRI5_DERPT|nr:hypothetical protein DERP_013253 [Dermatophagoides pteronyssinus]